MGTSSNDKGRELEDAVLLIERAILGVDGTDAANSIRMEQRKIVTVSGVRHEYDLWVELRGAPGYESLFVFECKNWSDKVGKNEVIIFSAKVAAAQAQRGFLVAPEFTSDARAQASLDPRVQLLDVRKEEYERFRAPLFPHFLMIDSQDSVVQVRGAELGDRKRRIDLAKVKLLESRQRVPFSEWVDRWRAELTEERAGRFPSDNLPAGSYVLDAFGRRTFEPGTCSYQGCRIEVAEMKVTMAVRIERPVFSGSIEVAGRGRVLHLEPITVAGIEAHLRLVDLPRNEDASEPGAKD